MKIFSKYLTETDCLKRLSIPSRVLSSFPEFHGGHAVDLLVRYETETVEWPLVCTVRRIGRYKKPVLSKGWRQFVVGNGLNVGDRVTFHKEDDESSSSMHYRVEMKRGAEQLRKKTKQFGGSGTTRDCDGGFIGRANACAEREIAATLLGHFSLGLPVGGNTVVRGSFVDLDLTLGRR